MVRLPGAGVGLENAGWDMVGRSGAFVPSEFCACGRLRAGVTGVIFVMAKGTTPQELALEGAGAKEMKAEDEDGGCGGEMTVGE